jgi:CRP/FNR family transcriptional regulator, cyclic AMP receptor protein
MQAELLNTACSLLEDRYRCSGDVAQVVAGRAQYRDYQPRTTIIAQGDRNEQVFLTVTGHARAEALSMSGRLAILEDYFAGDFFGEGGLVEDAPSHDEVRAVERVDAAVFANPAFVALLSSYADFALAFSRMLVARLARTSRRLAEGATLSATGRIYAELLRQARAGAGMAIEPSPVLSSFALTVQSTRETVSRTINDLVKRGIVRRDAQRLVVVAPHRLEELIY